MPRGDACERSRPKGHLARTALTLLAAGCAALLAIALARNDSTPTRQGSERSDRELPPVDRRASFAEKESAPAPRREPAPMPRLAPPPHEPASTDLAQPSAPEAPLPDLALLLSEPRNFGAHNRVLEALPATAATREEIVRILVDYLMAFGANLRGYYEELRPDGSAMFADEYIDPDPSIRAVEIVAASPWAEEMLLYLEETSTRENFSWIVLAVIEGLGNPEFDSRRVVETLFKYMDASHSRGVRLQSVQSFGTRSRSPADVERLARSLPELRAEERDPRNEHMDARNEYLSLKIAVIDSVARAGGPAAFPVLRELYTSTPTDVWVRGKIREELAQFPSSDALAFALEAAAEDGDALFLAKVKKPEAVPYLLRIMNDSTKVAFDRRYAALALADLRSPDAIPFLIDLLEEPDPKDWKLAIRTLFAVTQAKVDHAPLVNPTPEERKAAADAWRAWWAEHAREFK